MGNRPFRRLDVTKKSAKQHQHKILDQRGRITVIRRLNVVLSLYQFVLVDRLLVYQSSIAEIMRHHNRGIQRAKIERGNWDIIVAAFWFDNRSSFVLLVGA